MVKNLLYEPHTLTFLPIFVEKTQSGKSFTLKFSLNLDRLLPAKILGPPLREVNSILDSGSSRRKFHITSSEVDMRKQNNGWRQSEISNLLYCSYVK